MVSPPRAPIVLVHGLLGFDRVKVGPYTMLRYFPGIEEALVNAGHRVAVPNLSKTRGVTHRAEQLRRFVLDTFPDDRVHMIAHSMGGLDARYMISQLDMHERVLSLTTLGTPHRGTAFADWGIRRLSHSLRPFLHFWGVPTDAFDDLTTEACARFNEQVPDAPGVRYYSVAGTCPRDLLTPLWRPVAGLVTGEEGPNDGIVSVRSASYGEGCEVWDGDHMHLVNRPNPRATEWGHRPSDYLRLVSRLEP
ncbi:MAG TPA: alpha/beta fold hydrolase [Gemmataceae bacterium]|nr:alpha/beta fold hydrolase [Gemmataceae bacterium]